MVFVWIVQILGYFFYMEIFLMNFFIKKLPRRIMISDAGVWIFITDAASCCFQIRAEDQRQREPCRLRWWYT